MSQALLKLVANCGRCIQYEAKGQLPPMQPIICTEPLELVHIGYVGMEVTVATDKKPVVKNVLVVIDHFTRCSSWKNPPLEKTPPFTGAQNLWLQISNSEGGAQKNGYYQDVP